MKSMSTISLMSLRPETAEKAWNPPESSSNKAGEDLPDSTF